MTASAKWTSACHVDNIASAASSACGSRLQWSKTYHKQAAQPNAALGIDTTAHARAGISASAQEQQAKACQLHCDASIEYDGLACQQLCHPCLSALTVGLAHLGWHATQKSVTRSDSRAASPSDSCIQHVQLQSICQAIPPTGHAYVRCDPRTMSQESLQAFFRQYQASTGHMLAMQTVTRLTTAY